MAVPVPFKFWRPRPGTRFERASERQKQWRINRGPTLGIGMDLAAWQVVEARPVIVPSSISRHSLALSLIGLRSKPGRALNMGSRA